MSGAGGGLAGRNGGSFFAAPGWVDLKKRPGESRQVPPAWSAWALGVLKCGHVLYSPNFVWLSFALLDWFVFPWDLERAKTWAPSWVLHRLAVNALVRRALQTTILFPLLIGKNDDFLLKKWRFEQLTFGYTGFWHVTLYIWNW